MPDAVSLTYSEHICRVVSTALGLLMVMGALFFFGWQLWIVIGKALDNRQYRLETERRERIERIRYNAQAEREGWRQHDEYIVKALAEYARENHQMREFMAKVKVTDWYERFKAGEETLEDVHA